jgi:hypothetical protein
MLRSRRIFPSAVFFLSAISLVTLDGCGLYTPEKGLLQSDDVEPPPPGQPWPASPQGMYEYNVVQHIQCELRVGVWKAAHFRNSEWIKHAGGLATLKLVVQDQSSLNPNASFLQTFGLKGAESFTIGIGGTGSANATRTETFAFTYSNGELYKDALIDVAHGITDCKHLQKGVLIDSDLKIGQFIYDKVVVEGSEGPNNKLFSGLQFEINFVASFSGNITPTWKFTTTTVNGSGMLFSSTRTDTDDLIVTLGPLNADTKALHNAAVIGSAVGGANQSFSH